jgi:hypothetical protein
MREACFGEFLPFLSDGSGADVYKFGEMGAPGGLRTGHDDPPAYDDPSKFGGG